MSDIKLKHNFTYHIDARNAEFGIYDENKKGFRIAISCSWTRTYYSFIENTIGYEYEANITAFPLKEIEESPIFENEEDFISYIIDIENKF